LKEVATQAAYWLSFREGNDWYNLIDKSMKGLDLARERKINSMKVRRTKILDSRLPPDEKRWNTEEMAKDSIGGQMLLGMMAEKSLPENLYAVAKQFILNNPDPRVRIQASGYYHTSDETFSIQSVMALQSNSSNGEKVFMKSCATCHRLNKTGNDIGPELTFVQKKFDRESLLDAIIHPSAGILFAYEPWSISTKNGESYFGFLVADGKQTVVIKDLAGNKRTIPTASIQSRKRMEKSLMPEPSSLGLTEQNLADLSEYIMTLKQ
jgi:putative heme-binding domain-containing protein